MTLPPFRIRFYLLFAVLVLLSGCGNSGKEENKNVFKCTLSGGLISLDPAFAKDQTGTWVARQLFDGLVELDKDLKPAPAIAKSWEISEDGLTYRFVLRDDVFFHDSPAFPDGKGRKVVAQDFVYSFGRLLNWEINSPGNWVFKDKLDKDAPFTTEGERILIIHLKQPFRPLLSSLSLQYCSVVPKEVIEHFGRVEWPNNPVGTGPFQLKNWVENQTLVLERNKNYFQNIGNQQLPYLDGVVFKFSGNKEGSFLDFRQGNTHLLSGLDKSYIDQLIDDNGELQESYREGFKMYRGPYLNTEYFGFLMKSNDPGMQTELVADRSVRQAINFGIDRKKMLVYLRRGIGKPANAGMVPFGLPSYNEQTVKGYNYNPEKAAKLLAEAGYPGGEGLPKIILKTNPTYRDIGIFVKEQLSHLGIEVEIDMMQSAAQRELMAKGKAAFFRASWIADYADAQNYLSLFYSQFGAPPNYTAFSDKKFDALYEASLRENDDVKRYELYQAMDKIIVYEAPIVPLYYDEVVRFVPKNVEGLEPDAMNMLDLREVKIQSSM